MVMVWVLHLMHQKLIRFYIVTETPQFLYLSTQKGSVFITKVTMVMFPLKNCLI
jgi:hypothetical protein